MNSGKRWKKSPTTTSTPHEEDRPPKIINNEIENIRVKKCQILRRYRYKEVVKQRRAMIQIHQYFR